jgi:predicted lysophospholipase L1 biosynthesis ABC-type transport system permease subunit
MVFAPDTQHPAPGAFSAIMVYSTLDASVMGEAIRRAVLAHHPGIFIDTQDLAASVGSGLVRERVLAVLAAFFGGLATLLAIVGVYGLISFLVAARRTEIGVRLALGARPGQVVAMMMRQVVWLLALGVPLGAGVALLASQSARALLFRLEPHDPTTIALACLSLIVIAAAASLIPARRAARLDPLASLRSE